MHTELDELYKQVILDHNKNPRNFGVLPKHNHHAEGYNPLCGDQVNLTITLDDNIIKEVMFDGSGCAISKASASIMTTLVKGKSIEEARVLFEQFHDIVTADIDENIDVLNLGKLAVFCGVKEFPSRVKCASLAWHTLNQALENSNEVITTEI